MSGRIEETRPVYAEIRAASAVHPDSGAGAAPARSPGKGIARTVARSAALTLLGFAAAAIPLHLLLQRELRDAPEDVRSQGWPIRLMHVLFAKYVIPRIDVKGLENLPPGSYLVAANHAYKKGVNGICTTNTIQADLLGNRRFCPKSR